MKRCDYCGKEISYHEQYCCNNCKEEADRHFKREAKFKNFYGASSIIGVVGSMIGGFCCIFHEIVVGCSIACFSLLIVAIGNILMPLPTVNWIKKYKLKKALKLTRIVGIIAIAVSVLLGVVALYVAFV